MQKIGKRMIFGILGVSIVAAVGVMVFLQDEDHRSDVAIPAVQSTDVPWEGNKRTISHPDGSRSDFVRTPDHRTLSKYSYSSRGELSQMTVYRMDEKGNALGAKIFDGKKEELFKVSYGYRKSDGALVEERMFDSRKRRISPEDGKELPVWRFIHTWDESGKPAGRIEMKGNGASESDVVPKVDPTFWNPFSI